MPPTHEERNRAILRLTLSAISHLYALFSAMIGWSLLIADPKGDGLHGSRAIGRISLVLAAFYAAAGWALWKPRRGAWLLTLLAAVGSAALAVLDLLGRRPASLAIDGSYALVALALLLQARPRA